MSKVPFNPSTMVYPAPAVMVSCGDSVENYNIITIAWTGTINSKPPMTYVSVRKERHSHKLISENGGFVINLTGEALATATDYCGVKSGKDVNKFAHLGLTAVPATKIKACMIEEAPVSIECEVVQVIELGSHDMFMAKVVAVHVDDSLLDSTGKLHLERSKPIVYSHGEYYGLGEAIGKFGHAVMKKKTAEKLAKEKAEEDRKLEKAKLREEKKVQKEQAREAWEQNQKEWYQAKTKKIRDNHFKSDRKPRTDERPKSDWKPRTDDRPKSDWKPRTDDRPKTDWKPRTGDKPKSDWKPRTGDPSKSNWKPRTDDRPKSDWKPRTDDQPKSDWKPRTSDQGKPAWKGNSSGQGKPAFKPKTQNAGKSKPSFTRRKVD